MRPSCADGFTHWFYVFLGQPADHAASLTVTWLASSLRSAITVLRIRYAHGSPRGLIPTHSTKVPSISPISCRRLRISVFMQMPVTTAFSPGLKSAICLQCFMPSLPVSVKGPLISEPVALFYYMQKDGLRFEIIVIYHPLSSYDYLNRLFWRNRHAHIYRQA